MKPWHGDLIARVFQGGPTFPLAKVAAAVGQTEKACAKVLASDWGQAELARYHAARRQVLAQRGVRPLEELATFAHDAVRGLMRAKEMAEEQENPRELREACVAILNFLGLAPAKRVEKRVLHQVEQIDDPAILAEIVRTGQLPEYDTDSMNGHAPGPGTPSLLPAVRAVAGSA